MGFFFYEISVLLFIFFLCSLREKRAQTIFAKQRKELFFYFFSFLLALVFSQVQRSQCLVEAYVFWHTFSVSVNYARTRTYSTVGMRFGMIKANRSGKSLECVHPSQSTKKVWGIHVFLLLLLLVNTGATRNPSRNWIFVFSLARIKTDKKL